MNDILTHAITRPQPEAWALSTPGPDGQPLCPVICSDTRPDMARIGELIGIHASGHRPTMADRRAVFGPSGWEANPPQDLPRGALVGVARLKGVVRNRPDGFVRMLGASVGERIDVHLHNRIAPWWRPGTKWGLLLDEAVALSEPIPMRGAGGSWRLPDRPTEGRLHRQWQAFDRGMEAYSAGHGAIPPPPPAAQFWALEQWRKGRAER
jgi:hypothetical protein